MAKRGDKHDSTMEVSTSQLVGGPPRGDASVWKQVVVGTDQFAPAPEPPKPGNRRGLIVGVVAAAVLAGGGAVYWATTGTSAPSAIDAAPRPPDAPPPIDASAPGAPAPVATVPLADASLADAVEVDAEIAPTTVPEPTVPPRPAATKKKPPAPKKPVGKRHK